MSRFFVFTQTLFSGLILITLPLTAQTRPNTPIPTTKSDKDKDTDKEKDKKKLEEGLQYRSIGPYRGGRSLTAAGIPGDPNTWYFGSTGGGVWKSTDAALTWKPIFDHEKSSSIGSLAIAPSDPNTIYVGTGEACIRGNLAQGDGIYKSVDAGKSWKNIGLKDSRAIGKIIVHPTNPDIVFVAALGHPYGPNAERGLFRTTDGGKSWQKVLFVDDKTGAVDVEFDPHNPHILFASSLASAPSTLDPHQRRPRQRPLSLRRWRRHLEKTRRWSRRHCRRSGRPPRRSLWKNRHRRRR